MDFKKVISTSILASSLYIATPTKSLANETQEILSNTSDNTSFIIKNNPDIYYKIKNIINENHPDISEEEIKDIIKQSIKIIENEGINIKNDGKNVIIFILLFGLFFSIKKAKSNIDKPYKEWIEEASNNPMSSYDKNGKPLIWNKELEKITGYSFKEISEYFDENGEIESLLYIGDELIKVKKYLSLLKTGATDFYENIDFQLITKTGEERIIEWTTYILKNGCTIRSGKDITDFKNAQKMIKFDALTGALSRNALEYDFFQHINSRNKNKELNFVYIDIDNFKSINDSIGHHFGDFILKEVIRITKSKIRTNDKIYRVGGDEFIIIFDNGDKETISNKLNEIRKEINSIYTEANEITSISAGIVEYELDEKVSIEYLKNLTYLEIETELKKNKLKRIGSKSSLNIISEFLSNKELEKIKQKADHYMYGVKYFKEIRDKLIKEGRIDKDYDEKNGIAIPYFKENGELKEVKIINNNGTIYLTPEEIDIIEEKRKEGKNIKKDSL